ncbi:SDR family oxidoreductase [Kribbella antibiotica]|uniref:SDR family oxidoreductase n=1 Tax=Kribbella antibiotica TaxID=190195 RepID=A0A4R4ZQS2_9ACTN|nr:SDR family oxidoreductase [Kribbella antibiotica]TDD60249.1 SDR family oxidoreductase [Kribbella antibiotica]
MTILVTGGTGTLGKLVVPRLTAAGYDVRVLSRRGGVNADGVEHVQGDLLKADGLDLTGIDTILHLAGGAKGDALAATNLAHAAAAAAVRHIVHISVIGADTMPIGYFREKLGAEQAIRASGVPWTILRAAQFNSLTYTVAQKMAGLPIVPTPGGLRFQPVDERDVAARITELALGEPAGAVPDLAGPTVYTLRELVDTYLELEGKRRPHLPIRLPGKVGRAYRTAQNLTLTNATTANRTWSNYLTEKANA